eukprot:5943259-Pleurochrysis_carterae.AAC.1
MRVPSLAGGEMIASSVPNMHSVEDDSQLADSRTEVSRRKWAHNGRYVGQGARCARSHPLRRGACRRSPCIAATFRRRQRLSPCTVAS